MVHNTSKAMTAQFDSLRSAESHAFEDRQRSRSRHPGGARKPVALKSRVQARWLAEAKGQVTRVGCAMRTARRPVSFPSVCSHYLGVPQGLSRARRPTGARPKWAVLLVILALEVVGWLACVLQPQRAVTEADIPSEISQELRTLIQDTFSRDPRKRGDAAERLGDIGERAAPAAPFVIRLLRDDTSLGLGTDAWVGGIASRAIPKIGTPAIDILLVELNDPDVLTRSYAILGLEHSADPRIVVPLIARFRDSDEDVRELAVDHFRKHQDPRVVSPLLQMLKDQNESVRHSAILAIGGQRDCRTIPDLLAILRQGSENDRRMTAFALTQIGDQAGLDAVVGVLNNLLEKPSLRISAAGALGNAGACGATALESLVRVLRDSREPPALRGGVAQVLPRIQGTKAVPLLSEIARCSVENDRVRFWAAMSVIELADGAIDDPLILTPLSNGYVDLQMPENLTQAADRVERTAQVLAKVAKRGRTPAVRAQASQVLTEVREGRSGKGLGDGKQHESPTDRSDKRQ